MNASFQENSEFGGKQEDIAGLAYVLDCYEVLQCNAKISSFCC
jgi:hypothetical protein